MQVGHVQQEGRGLKHKVANAIYLILASLHGESNPKTASNNLF